MEHIPVLRDEIIQLLQLKKNGIYVDGTFGLGGHAKEIAKYVGADGLIVGIDKDDYALKHSFSQNNVLKIHGNYQYIRNYCNALKIDKIDGMLVDLGLSSLQLDHENRGFSYLKDEPLLMKFNSDQTRSAADVVNHYQADELAGILMDYGEIRSAYKIANNIIKQRTKKLISTTFQLRDVVLEAISTSKPFKLLSKVFQAIRIETNQELDAFKYFLQHISRVIKPSGVLAIITYHSIEDRMTKRFFNCGNIDGKVHSDVYGERSRKFDPITNIVRPTTEEINQNKRSRSAILRVGIKNHK